MTPKTLHTGDCLDITRDWPAESIDLIYLDPPFNSGRDYGAFYDTWKWTSCKADFQEAVKEENLTDCLNGLHLILKESKQLAYLSYMANRLRILHRILKPTGSIYLHCDSTTSHYLKVILDCIFGQKNFRNEIVWHYPNTLSPAQKLFARNYDQIFFYSKTKAYHFNILKKPRNKPRRREQIVYKNGKVEIKRDANGNTLYRTYHDTKVTASWTIPSLRTNKERTGYPTQKPTALLERIIKASSNEGDTVLDPFCGSGTTLVAAKTLNRNYIGIDTNTEAIELTEKRLRKARTHS